MFEHAAAVTADEPHTVRQVRIQIFELGEVEVLYFGPGITFEVFPRHDDTMMFIGPGPVLRRSGGRIRDERLMFRERKALFEADEVIPHPVPERDEVVQERFQFRTSGSGQAPSLVRRIP